MIGLITKHAEYRLFYCRINVMCNNFSELIRKFNPSNNDFQFIESPYYSDSTARIFYYPTLYLIPAHSVFDKVLKRFFEVYDTDTVGEV